MKVKTIVSVANLDRKSLRWCMRCGVHLDKEDNIDLDFYTARQYVKLTAVPLSKRCYHSCERPDTKEELIKKIGGLPLTSEIRDVLAGIVRRLS